MAFHAPSCSAPLPRAQRQRKSDLDLLVDSKLRGLKFVGFMEDVRQAAGMPVDVFDISHIEQGY